MAGEATAFVIDASADGGDEAADPVVYCFPEEEAEAEGATRQQRLRRTALLLLGLGDVFGQLTGHALGRASFAGRDCSAGVASLGHPSLALAVFFAAASGRCCCCSRPQRVAEHVAAVARLRAADPAAEIRAGRAGPLLGPVLRVVFARMASSARFPAAHVFPALLLPPPPTRAADADADAGADATALLSELCESRFDGLVHLPRSSRAIGCAVSDGTRCLASCKLDPAQVAAIVDALAIQRILPRTSDARERVGTVDVWFPAAGRGSNSSSSSDITADAPRSRHTLVFVGVRELVLCVMTAPTVPQQDRQAADQFLIHDARMLMRTLLSQPFKHLLENGRDFTTPADSEAVINVCSGTCSTMSPVVSTLPPSALGVLEWAIDSMQPRKSATAQLILPRQQSQRVGAYAANPSMYKQHPLPSVPEFQRIQVKLGSTKWMTLKKK